MNDPKSNRDGPALVDVGRRLRELRHEHGYSIRVLAEKSGLNVNTLSLIENEKTSPSVSTLQQIAAALVVPITSFFEMEPPQTNVVHQKANERKGGAIPFGLLENLGIGLVRKGLEPFVLTLQPGGGSGDVTMAHTGLEFVFCLEGQMAYKIQDEAYTLEVGDSLLFEARLAHAWYNSGSSTSQSLLIFCHSNDGDIPTLLHFPHSS